ncbi:MAG: CPBP family intramembrane glutamic endopeptidase [Oscillospiraceae bacterium]
MVQAIILGFVLYWVATAAINGLLQWLYPGLRNANNDSITTMAGVDYRAMLLYTVALAPVTEEALFRGLFFSSIHKKHRILAYTISALAFAALHIVGYLGTVPAWQLGLSLLQYLPAGIALAWAYERAEPSGPPSSCIWRSTALSMLALQAM